MNIQCIFLNSEPHVWMTIIELPKVTLVQILPKGRSLLMFVLARENILFNVLRWISVGSTENAGLENVGPKKQGWKMQDWKM